MKKSSATLSSSTQSLTQQRLNTISQLETQQIALQKLVSQNPKDKKNQSKINRLNDLLNHLKEDRVTKLSTQSQINRLGTLLARATELLPPIEKGAMTSTSTHSAGASSSSSQGLDLNEFLLAQQETIKELQAKLEQEKIKCVESEKKAACLNQENLQLKDQAISLTNQLDSVRKEFSSVFVTLGITETIANNQKLQADQKNLLSNNEELKSTITQLSTANHEQQVRIQMLKNQLQISKEALQTTQKTSQKTEQELQEVRLLATNYARTIYEQKQIIEQHQRGQNLNSSRPASHGVQQSIGSTRPPMPPTPAPNPVRTYTPIEFPNQHSRNNKV